LILNYNRKKQTNRQKKKRERKREIHWVIRVGKDPVNAGIDARPDGAFGKNNQKRDVFGQNGRRNWTDLKGKKIHRYKC